MKTHPVRHSVVSPLLLALAAFAPPVFGSPGADSHHRPPPRREHATLSAEPSHHPGVRVAPEGVRARGVEAILGRGVQDREGEAFGRIKEFLIDRSSGRLAFAVISVGGFAGIGDTLRLLPFSLLQPAAANEPFTTSHPAGEHRTLPRVADDDLTGGRDELVAASALRGSTVRAGRRSVGEISDVVIDFQSATAAALVEPEPAFTGSNREFLVPLRDLQITGAAASRVDTTLGPADFQQAVAQERAHRQPD